MERSVDTIELRRRRGCFEGFRIGAWLVQVVFAINSLEASLRRKKKSTGVMGATANAIAASVDSLHT